MRLLTGPLKLTFLNLNKYELEIMKNVVSLKLAEAHFNGFITLL